MREKERREKGKEKKKKKKHICVLCLGVDRGKITNKFDSESTNKYKQELIDR